MGDVKLRSPRIKVIRDGHEPLEIQADNRDLIAWDMTRAKHKWPKFDDAPFMWLTFTSWHAARRTGAIPPDYTWERWREETLEVTSLDDDDADNELGTPTEPGPAPG